MRRDRSMLVIIAPAVALCVYALGPRGLGLVALLLFVGLIVHRGRHQRRRRIRDIDPDIGRLRKYLRSDDSNDLVSMLIGLGGAALMVGGFAAYSYFST